MLHEFKVKNYLSFKEEQTLSMEATADKTYEDFFCIEMTPKIKLLKLGLIYGANASGKSNLLLGLNSLLELVLEAKNNKIEPIPLLPFLLDNISKQENTEFSISFFIDKIRYVYEISFNQKHIDKEILQFYPNLEPILLFERTFNAKEEISEIKFGKELNVNENEIFVLRANTIKNSTLLSIYNKSNIKITHLNKVTIWFHDTLKNVLTPDTILTKMENEEVEKSEKNKKSILDILQKADFNISDIAVQEVETEISEELSMLLQQTTNLTAEEERDLLNNRKIKRKSLSFLHQTASGEYSIPFQLQSEGTKRYYGLASLLNRLIPDEMVLPIDEIESSLHFELINHFLKTFLVNTSNSQVICTTHNTDILEQDYLRKDAVWFCEKNEEGATELFSAADFDWKEGDSLYQFYKIGKLGAVPNMGNILLNKYQITK